MDKNPDDETADRQKGGKKKKGEKLVSKMLMKRVISHTLGFLIYFALEGTEKNPWESYYSSRKFSEKEI